MTQITDINATVVWQSEYNPFGAIAGNQGTYAFTGIFTGKDVDADTGFFYFNARWYDASNGRFLSEDPAGQGSNWYAYGGNNPLTNVDPSGLWGFNFGFFLDVSWDSQNGFGIGFGFGCEVNGVGYSASLDVYQNGTIGLDLGAGVDGAQVGGASGGAVVQLERQERVRILGKLQRVYRRTRVRRGNNPGMGYRRSIRGGD